MFCEGINLQFDKCLHAPKRGQNELSLLENHKVYKHTGYTNNYLLILYRMSGYSLFPNTMFTAHAIIQPFITFSLHVSERILSRT
jgi:hypothetical protein